MKNVFLVVKLVLFIVVFRLLFSVVLNPTKENTKASYTNLVIKNSSSEDSIKVYLTLQAPNSVVGFFGIKAQDTIGSCSKGTFYAKKGVKYPLNYSKSLFGAVLSFNGDNLPCQVSVPLGYKKGINIFEFSINTPYEVFDISCEDGVNAILKASVLGNGWTTGDGSFIKTFKSAKNVFPLENNLNIRGVFPYRCTDCKDLGSAVPENCFNLKDTCNTERICQVARTNKKGGIILLEYLGKAE